MTDVENLARNLCMGDGYNPDDLLMPYQAFAIGAHNRAIINPQELRPSWMFYAHYVRMVLSLVLERIADKPDDEHRQIIEDLLREIVASEGEPELEEEEDERQTPPGPADWRARYFLDGLATIRKGGGY